MLKSLFIPTGDAGRVRFALVQLGYWGFGLGYLAVGTVWLKSLGPPDPDRLPLLLTVYAVSALTMVTLIWCNVVSWIQRLRDMGWRPWPSLMAALVVTTAEGAVLDSAFGIKGFSVLGLLFIIALIAWPSRAPSMAVSVKTGPLVDRSRRRPGQFGLRGA